MRTKIQITKKILSVVLSALVIFSCVPMSVISVSAASDLTVTIDTGASVTLTDADADDYYDIGTADELYAFAAIVNGGNRAINGELTADIVVNEGTMTADSTGARVWTPIGNSSVSYRGTFNGNNKTISGLYFNDIEVWYVGLFGCAGDYVGSNSGIKATIKNVGIINSYFNSYIYVGSIVGEGKNAAITNCYNTSIITGKYGYAGGIIGIVNGGEITNCYNTSDITGACFIGGIAGKTFGVITNYNDDLVIRNCYNTGNLNATSYSAGGIVGANEKPSTIANCYSTGNATSRGDAGAIVGTNKNNEITATNIYYLANSETDSVEGTTAKTEEEFKSGEVAYLLQGDQTEDVWGQSLGTGTYPALGGDKVYTGYTSHGEIVFSNNPVVTPEHIYNNGFCDCGDYEEPKLVDGYYEIDNAGKLYWFADKVNNDNANFSSANAKLTANIIVNTGTMSADTDKDSVRHWTPIGNDSEYYIGKFNGNNYTVSGLYFNNTDVEYVGLFGSVYIGGTVENVGVINSYFNADEMVGGVVGVNAGIISNCYNTGTVSGSYDFIGGVAGANLSVSDAGGIITDCYNTGLISGRNNVGGVVGFSSSGTIKNCYNTGDVNGVNEHIGGIIGSIQGNTSTITNCYNVGDVTATGTCQSVGGIVGWCSISNKLSNCFNTGDVSGSGDNIGAIAGWSYGKVENSYYLADSETDSIDGTTFKTAEQFSSGEVAYLLQSEQTEDVWGQSLGTGTYPSLGGDKVYGGYTSCSDNEKVYSNNPVGTETKPDHIYDNGFCDCGGYEEPKLVDGYYEIDNAGKLYWFAEEFNNGDIDINGKLTANIVVNQGEMSAETDKDTVRHWTPIGDMNTTPYMGTFDGDGHTISGLYVNDDSAMFVGLFGGTGEGSKVENTGVINSYFKGEGFVGAVVAGTVGEITGCYNDKSVVISNSLCAGGVVGASQFGKITNCYNTGTVSCTATVSDQISGGAGGVVGIAVGVVENCYNTGTVTSARGTGGIVGLMEDCTVSNCYNTGDITATSEHEDYGSSSGGIVGMNANSKIVNCYNAGAVKGISNVGGVTGYNYSYNHDKKTEVENCYNTGTVSGTENIGGISGLSDEYVTITNSYYLADNETDSCDGTTFKTEAQFKSGEVAYLLQGEQTEDVWGQKINTDTYPSLGGDKVYGVKNCKGDVAEYSNTNDTTAAAHNFNKTHVCKDCYALEDDQLAGIYSYSISLGGNIAVNYYMVLDDSVIADPNAKVVFGVPNGGKTDTVEFKVSEATKNGEFYVFTCEVAAKEMTSEITCKAVSGDNESTTFTYSVKQYADVIIEKAPTNEAFAKAVPLVKAMLNYGANAQLYFDYNKDKLANADLTEAEKQLPANVDLSAYAGKLTGSQEGVSFYGSTLLLNSKTGFNIYFKVAEGIDVSTIPVTVNNTAVTPVKNGSYYQIKIANIPAQSIDNTYKIKIGGITVNYGVFSYGHSALNTSSKETLKNTIKAMYVYNQAAINYAA